MSDITEPPAWDQRSFGWKTSLLLCLVLVAVAASLLYLIFNTEPTARRAAGTKSTAMLVDVTSFDSGTYRPTIEVTGTVRPAQEIVLRPRVTGEILERSPNFTPGGFVKAGETLVKIDPADYRNNLKQAKAYLRQARSQLQIELGRQDVAQEEYQLFAENLTEENRQLVLRKPQLNSARAQVENARAAVDQARLELERTNVKSPFDAKILARNANFGSQVNVGDNLARIVGLDTYWVETTVPLSHLRWLSFPDTSTEQGAPVRIRNQSAWASDQYRTGRLHKLGGELDEKARMAKVLISVSDPLARGSNSGDSPSLIVGSYVEASIKGKAINNAIRLPREYVRENDTVWVMKNEKLDIRNVEIAYRNKEYAYVIDGLNSREYVVTTNLSTVVDGAPLRTGGATGRTSKTPDSQSSDGSV
ncbi:MAG: efflux RND transporter periplasmic adaptor subunit [bacterium]